MTHSFLFINSSCPHYVHFPTQHVSTHTHTRVHTHDSWIFVKPLLVAGISERRSDGILGLFTPCLHVCFLADSNFVLGNAQVTGLFPVVYCSDGFCDLTGFSRAEVMQRGCACSFLYGPDTSELVRQQIRKALDEHKEFKAELILYRKSGEGPPGQPASPLVTPSLAPTPSFVPPFHFHHCHLPISSHLPTYPPLLPPPHPWPWPSSFPSSPQPQPPLSFPS